MKIEFHLIDHTLLNIDEIVGIHKLNPVVNENP